MSDQTIKQLREEATPVFSAESSIVSTGDEDSRRLLAELSFDDSHTKAAMSAVPPGAARPV